jgi:hypothetical protein
MCTYHDDCSALMLVLLVMQAAAKAAALGTPRRRPRAARPARPAAPPPALEQLSSAPSTSGRDVDGYARQLSAYGHLNLIGCSQAAVLTYVLADGDAHSIKVSMCEPHRRHSWLAMNTKGWLANMQCPHNCGIL